MHEFVSLPLRARCNTIDPITEATVDQNNMMILTGTTSLPEDTQLGVLVFCQHRLLPGE